ncbi:uncharacterized protein [Amphiura filiformis]|uniref:uncharacterized protein n=1 Tax=Amphiura filiformis TaxID=82378 RepID=UPI003B20F3B3
MSKSLPDCHLDTDQTTSRLPATSSLRVTTINTPTATIGPRLTPTVSAPKPIICIPASHSCCNFPNINTDSVTFSFITTPGNNTTEDDWTLDVIATWNRPQGPEFNGYGVCLETPPKTSAPSGLFCTSSPGSFECDYQYTDFNGYTFHNVPYGHSYFVTVRVAFLDTSGTAKYLAPREGSLQVDTPDCFEETGDLEYCKRQPIPIASKPTDVTLIRFIRLNDDSADVVVSWRQPIQLNGLLDSFFIKATYYVQDRVAATDFATRMYVNETQRNNGRNTVYYVTLEDLLQNSTYTINITTFIYNSTLLGAVTSIPLFIPVLEPITTPQTPNTIHLIPSSPVLSAIEISVVVVCGFIAFIITIVVIVIILAKRREEKDDSVFVRYPDDSIYRKPSSSVLHDIEEKEIDPVCVDIEMDRSRLKVEEELGSGQFGVVYKAFAFGLSGDKEEYIPVAVKGLKGNATRAMKEDFLDEIKLIIEIGSHPNILTILGCITADEPYYLVTEFMKYGDLLHFLWRCREEKYISMDPNYRITNVTKMQIAHQIARGMDYLSKTRYYHGDLAARNILVGDDLAVKISDFGMADDIYMRGYKRLAPERKRPIKWVSLETNTKGQCSIEGDVWSYGIVLYEIVTLGGAPYPNMEGRAIIDKLQEGYRMEQPDGCPAEFYDVMRKCWLENPSERPKFHDLYQTFDKMLATESDYLPAFELMTDDDDDDCVDSEIEKETDQEIPPSYKHHIDYAVNIQKTRSNSYVMVKTEDQLTTEEEATIDVVDETEKEEDKVLGDTVL